MKTFSVLLLVMAALLGFNPAGYADGLGTPILIEADGEQDQPLPSVNTHKFEVQHKKRAEEAAEEFRQTEAQEKRRAQRVEDRLPF